MAELLVANGGRVMESLGKETTHLIVDENTVENLPDDLDIPSHCFLVKGEWFWNSIQVTLFTLIMIIFIIKNI